MSDTSQGPGWWLASDGKWYPLEQAPVTAQPVNPQPMGAAAPQGPGWWQATDSRWYPPQPGVPVQVQIVKKKFYQRVWFWLLIVVAVGIASCSALVIGAGVAVNNANQKQHTVVYTVSGTGSADITYFAWDNNHGGSADISNAPLPWTKTITGSGLFNSYSVIATVGPNGGSASCSVTVDGNQVSTNTASGALSAATCTGSAS